MKPHPRIRKTVKWGGAAVTVLLVVVWIGSGWWHAGMDRLGDAAVALHKGCIDVVVISPSPLQPAVHFAPYSGGGLHLETRFTWWTVPPVRRFSMPLWLPAGIALLITAAAWRLDILARGRERAVHLNLCPKCNYDRAGLGAGVACPECGSSPDTN